MGPAEPNMSNANPKTLVIARLARDGSNWITWKSQTLAVLSSIRGVKRHIDGKARKPADPPTFADKHVMTEEDEEDLELAEKRWDDYEQREAIIKAQIYGTIPESLQIEVQKLDTAKEIWDAICAKHEAKALTVKIDMRRRLYEMKCEDESNVRTHLEAIMKTQEQLAGMDAGLEDPELVTFILGSLPSSYRPLINAITMSSKLAGVELAPSTVVESLIDEFDRLTIEQQQLKASENALVTTKFRGKRQGRGGGTGSSRADVECWKCGRKGHIRANCHSKEKKKRREGEEGAH